LPTVAGTRAGGPEMVVGAAGVVGELGAAGVVMVPVTCSLFSNC